MKNKDQIESWLKVKKKYGVTDAEVRKAKILGMDPEMMLKNPPRSSERWKEPTALHISRVYARKYEHLTDVSENDKEAFSGCGLKDVEKAEAVKLGITKEEVMSWQLSAWDRALKIHHMYDFMLVQESEMKYNTTVNSENGGGR